MFCTKRWQIDGESLSDFIFLGSKITAYGDCSHEIKRYLLLGRNNIYFKMFYVNVYFKKNAKLLSRVAITFYIPIGNVWYG